MVSIYSLLIAVMTQTIFQYDGAVDLNSGSIDAGIRATRIEQSGSQHVLKVMLMIILRISYSSLPSKPIS